MVKKQTKIQFIKANIEAFKECGGSEKEAKRMKKDKLLMGQQYAAYLEGEEWKY